MKYQKVKSGEIIIIITKGIDLILVTATTMATDPNKDQTCGQLTR